MDAHVGRNVMFQAFDGRGKTPLGPDEVSMLQGLISEYCRERAFDPASTEARDAAKDVLACFQRGVTERSKLKELLSFRY
jgi:hypothetical protein